MEKKLKKYSLDEIKDEFIGKKGTTEREQYEYDLQMDVLGELIKQTRIERKLTQEQLGDLIGVQKAQISRLENHTGNVTLSTILKVFSALKAKIKMQVELEGNSYCYSLVTKVRLDIESFNPRLNITRMVCLSAFGRPDSFAIDPKHYGSSFCFIY